MARLILDSQVLTAAVRGRLDLAALSDSDDVALPAVAVADFLAAAIVDHNPGRVAAQRTFLHEVLQVLPIVEYGREVAEQHAELLAHLRYAGRRCDAHDLIIAATARASERIIMTTQEQPDFAGLPKVAFHVYR